MRGKLSNEQKQLAFRLRAHGMSLVDIARQTGCTAPMVGLMVRDGLFTSGLPSDWEPRPGALTVTDREAILLGIGCGESLSMIARGLGRAPSTITREVNANGGRVGYRAWWAHRRARDCARRPKPFKLAGGPLLDEVSKGLLELWSPLEIAGRLLLDHPQRPDMHVSPETIYQSLFVDGRGALRRELARCLRSGRTARRSRQFRDGRERIPERIMIGERPDDVDDRQTAGHWEGDLVLGENGRSAVGTLVERSCRFVLVLHLRNGRAAVSVEAALKLAIANLPSGMCRSITWDQGAEMSTHAAFIATTDVPISFCDAHSPWQRESSENTNGLLRQYLPKGTDLSVHTAADLRRIQDSLNNRPRRTLGYLTPSEKFTELVASTT